MKSKCILFAWLASGMVVLAAEYTIQLHRPMSAGQQFQMKTEVRQNVRTTMSAGTRLARSDNKQLSAEFEGHVKVLEVDDKGRITKAECTVATFSLDNGSGRKDALYRDAVVLASLENGKKKFELHNRPLEGEVWGALALTMPLSIEGPTDDDVFGTDEPQRLGDSWKVNAAPFLELLKKQMTSANEEDLQGTVLLDRLVEAQGEPCMEIAAKVFLKKVSFPTPPGMQVKQSFGSLRFTGILPLNPEIGPLESTVNFSLDVTAAGAPPDGGGGEVTLKISTTLSQETEVTYLK